MKPLASLLILALLTVHLPAAPTDDADRDALLKGVNEIDTDGVPGGVSAFGPEAFAVVAGKEGGALLPIVAAARWEKGRIVAFGHDGFFRTPNERGNGTLLVNAARWASGDAVKPRIGVMKNPALLEHFKQSGLDAIELDEANLVTKLDGLSAVCIGPLFLTPAGVAPLEKFIRSGGGLLSGVTGWGVLQIFRKDAAQLAAEFPGNLLLEPAGLVYTTAKPGRILPNAYSTGGDLTYLNAATALQSITDHKLGNSALTPRQLNQCSTTLTDAVRSLPPDDRILLPKIAALADQPVKFPSPSEPMRADDPLARLLVILEIQRLRSAKPEQLAANSASYSFPGMVPKTAPRIADRTLTINTAVPQWHSTGLYAAPGEIIRVYIPPAVAGKGFGVRIGCHTDTLWHLGEWKRVPEISRRVSLDAALTTAANPFGGLVYIDVPDKASPGKVSVRISGAVEAPHFILGKTSVTDWNIRIRENPAPWAEFETEKVILSVPSERIRMLDDPDALMILWDRVLDAEADLSTIPHERKRPERIVSDIQISGGYLHSGYPIMTGLDHTVEQAMSTHELAHGSWGHFHELGHNHQQPDWTFDGTVEVTCNLYSLYVMETVCGRPPGQGHDAMKPGSVAVRFRNHLAEPDKFARWKNDPFVALIMYLQLRNGFGWETYKKVFAEYRGLPQSDRPKNDDEKRDQWLVRFSRAAGKNLGPFFEAWGVPTTAAARQSIADLPAWMPEGWPGMPLK